MTKFGKRRLQEVLDEAGLKLSDLCRALALHPSAATRWTAGVPRYALFYALAMREMTPDQRRNVVRALHAIAGPGHSSPPSPEGEG